ncbi:MAG TPA: hypothetical protein VF861_04505 [Telluria sp.]
MSHPRLKQARHWKRALPAFCLAAACLAAPLHGASAAGSVSHRTDAAQERGEAYTLVRNGKDMTKVGTNSLDRAAIKELKQSIGGDFFWFRSEGKTWVAQDRALLDKVAAAFAPIEQLGRQMEVHGEQMKGHGDVMKSLGGDMALATASLRPQRMEEIGKQMEQAGKPMEALGKKMEVLGKQMEKEGERADQTVRALMRQAVASGQARPVAVKS